MPVGSLREVDGSDVPRVDAGPGAPGTLRGRAGSRCGEDPELLDLTGSEPLTLEEANKKESKRGQAKTAGVS